MAEEQAPEGSAGPNDTGAERLGRAAARFVRRARPKVEQLVRENRPRVEKAGQDALRLAREHEDEIKQSGLKLARMRVPGPLGQVIDAFASRPASTKAEPAPEQACPACKATNAANARFCSQCGSPLDKA